MRSLFLEILELFLMLLLATYCRRVLRKGKRSVATHGGNVSFLFVFLLLLSTQLSLTHTEQKKKLTNATFWKLEFDRMKRKQERTKPRVATKTPPKRRRNVRFVFSFTSFCKKQQQWNYNCLIIHWKRRFHVLAHPFFFFFFISILFGPPVQVPGLRQLFFITILLPHLG